MAALDVIASELLKSAIEADLNYKRTLDQAQKDKALRLRRIVENLKLFAVNGLVPNLDQVLAVGNTSTNTLNVGGITTDYVQLDTAATPTLQPGMFAWNDQDGTANLRLKGGNVTLQVGQETLARVVNKTGADLLESQYKVVRVRIASEGGSQGQRLAVVLAQGNNDPDSVTTLGLVTENIPNNQEGFITIFGNVNGINTTGSLQGETWVDGDVLFLSPTTPGALTKVKPVAPNHTVVVGYVLYAHGVNGKIFVKVDNGYELDELHNVKITSVANNDLLQYDSTQQVWKNVPVATAVPTPTLATVTTAGNTTANTIIYSGTTEAIRPSVDSSGVLGASNFRWGTVYTRALSSGANTLDILGPAINLNDTSGNIKVKLFSSTGNVVIQNGGTFTDAGYRLDVQGNTRVNGGNTSADTPFIINNRFQFKGDGVLLYGNAAGHGRLTWDGSGAYFTGLSGYGVGLGANGVLNHLFINTSGNVGIGTTSPDYKLHVVNSEAAHVAIFVGNSRVYGAGQGAWGSALHLGKEENGVNQTMGLIIGAPLNETSSGDGYLSFGTRTGGAITTRMYIANTGNVGIGTSSPSSRLEVVGLSIFTNSTGNSYNENIRLPEATSGFSSVVMGGANATSGTGTTVWSLLKNPSASGHRFTIRNNATDYLTILTNGNVGIGTTSPSYKLQVDGSVYFNGSTNDFYVDGVSRFGGTTGYSTVITNSGSIGVGTTSPTYKLDVNGTARISNNFTVEGTFSYVKELNATRYFQIPTGVPTNNLGTPTVTEMALFDEQFDNKTAFYPFVYGSSILTFETYNGTTWTDISSTITDTEKKKLFGGDNSSNIAIPYGTIQYQITINNPGPYVYLNALYNYWSGSGHSMQVHIWKKHNSGSWVQHTNSTTTVSSWPGHLYLPFSTIPWHPAGTLGTHYNQIRIVYTPTWNATYPTNNISLYKLQMWGGYPASKRVIYSTDENRNVTFSNNLTASGTLTTGSNLAVTGTSAFTQLATFYNGITSRSATPTISFDRNGSYTWRLIVGDGTTYPTSTLNVVNNAGTAITTFLDSGNVGIGTTSPAVTLNVQNGGSTPKAVFQHGTLAHLGVLIGSTGGGFAIEDNNYFAIWHQDYTNRGTETGITERLRITTGGNILIGTTTDSGYRLDVNGTLRGVNSAYFATSSGNVGVGTTSPYDKLEVNGAISATGAAVANSAQTHATTLSVESGVSYLYAVDWGVEYKPLGIRAQTISLQTGTGSTTDRLFINSTGNVGIGTTTPTDKLHIIDSSNANIFGRITATGTNASAAWVAMNNQNDNVVYRVFGDGVTGSQMGISLVRSASLLANLGGSGAFLIGTYSGTDMVFGTANVENMRISNNTGNLLIGTTTDVGNMLEVAGVINGLAYSVGNVPGWTGTIVIMSNPPGQQNIQVDSGIITNVF